MITEEKCNLAIRLGYSYDPITGDVTKPSGDINRRKKTIRKKNVTKSYLRIRMKAGGKSYYLSHHTFAWYSMYGYLPECIDHKNGDGLDNRLENIRESTGSLNSINRIGVKGYTKKQGKFVASITVNGIRRNLGNFIMEEDAAEAYRKARRDLFGE